MALSAWPLDPVQQLRQARGPLRLRRSAADLRNDPAYRVRRPDIDVSILQWVLAIGVVIFAAAVQGSVGAGFNILSVPLLALIDPMLSPVPLLLVSLPLALSTALRKRAHVNVSGIRWIMAGRVPGLLIGLWILAVATETTVFVMIALLILAMVASMAFGLRIRRGRSADFGAGVVAGVAGLVAAIGGPPLALLYRDERGPTIRSTLGALFTFGVTLSIGARALTGHIAGSDVAVAAIFLVPTGVGFAISSQLLARVDDAAIRRAILVLSAPAAFALLLKSLIL